MERQRARPAYFREAQGDIFRLEKAVKMGRLTKIVLSLPGVANGAFAGPWNDFTHVRGPRVYKAVDKWRGPANYFSVGAFNAPNLPSWINFGGFDHQAAFSTQRAH